MNTKINLQTILIVFMICMTVIVTTNSYAKAQMGGETNILQNVPESEIMIDPVDGGPGFIMVSPYEFKPYDPDNIAWSHNGPTLYSTATDFSIFEAGVHLPHGASITQVTLYFYDNTSTDMEVYLVRSAGLSWAVAMAGVNTSGATAEYRTAYTTTINNSKVDNQNYSYYLELMIPGNSSLSLSLSNVRIDYEYTVYTPTIMK